MAAERHEPTEHDGHRDPPPLIYLVPLAAGYALSRWYPVWFLPAAVTSVLGWAGVALLTRSLWALVLLPFVLIVVQHTVIERAERYLERRFGAGYVRYTRRVRRWL